MSIRENKPPFVKSETQVKYYEEVYDDLVANDIPLQTQDRWSLGVLAINLCLIEEYALNIEEDGASIEVMGDRNVVTKPNPAINGLKDAQNMVKGLFKDFKMTPTSRGAKTSSGAKDGKSEPTGFDSFMANVRTK